MAQPGGGDLHQHLAGSGFGLGKIGVAQGAGVAGDEGSTASREPEGAGRVVKVPGARRGP